MSDVQHSDRNYRRGAIMGLTIAEAFILIAFALLLLFAFWQWEVEKQNTPEVVAFKELTYEHRQTVLVSAQDGSIEAFIHLKEQGVDFATPASVENPKDKWRFVDQDEVLRLIDAAQKLPEDMQRDLADMVEADKAKDMLSEMAILEDLVDAGKSVEELIASSQVSELIDKSGKSVEELLQTAQIIESLENSGKSMDDILAASDAIDAVNEAGHDLNEILKTAQILESLAASGKSVEELIATAAALEDLEKAGQSLEGISEKIRDAEAQEAALVGTLRSELGGIVSSMGGHIDDTGAIILPDGVLFQQGSATIRPSLKQFLAQACQPWLSTLKQSGVDISEVKIEGHASSEWRSGSSPRAAYLGNLNLSQLRSQAVLRSCLYYVKDPDLLDWSRKHLIAVGYSSVRPVLANGEEDRAASRRVVFSATPNRQSLLEEIEAEAKIARYDRSLFGGWADFDNDCQNTRQELLQELSTGATILARNNCTVVRGKWYDPYTGKTFTDAREVDVDHLVPLKWAWDRGAHSWTAEKREAFANDKANLMVVDRGANREKGANGPLNWLPPLPSYQCQYVTRFRRVVSTYKIILLHEEEGNFNRLQENVCK